MKLIYNRSTRIFSNPEQRVFADNKWVAIEITTANNSYTSKETTSQRVVTLDTYNELRSKGYTKGYLEIRSLDKLSPVCSSKEAAMGYLDAKEKKMRKTKINKGNADYIVWCISSGSMNPSGKTKWDWNFWEEWKDSEIYISDYGRSFLMGRPGSLKVGDKVCCVDNDTQKKLPGAPNKIAAVCKCNIEDFRKTFRKNWPSICKNPSTSFGRESDGLPWGRMGQFYSIKGIAEDA